MRLLLLTTLAAYALHRNDYLSLPIPNILGALCIALPPLAGVALETTLSLIATANNTSTPKLHALTTNNNNNKRKGKGIESIVPDPQSGYFVASSNRRDDGEGYLAVEVDGGGGTACGTRRRVLPGFERPQAHGKYGKSDGGQGPAQAPRPHARILWPRGAGVK